MKLDRVFLVNSVDVNGSNNMTLHSSNGAMSIVWEAGLVWFEDKAGKHAVPASNVKHMVLVKGEKK